MKRIVLLIITTFIWCETIPQSISDLLNYKAIPGTDASFSAYILNYPHSYKYYFAGVPAKVKSITGKAPNYNLNIEIPLGLPFEPIRAYGYDNTVFGSNNPLMYEINNISINNNLFEKKQDLNLGFTPTGIARADFDQDGLLDLAISCAADSAVYIFKNQSLRGSLIAQSFVKILKLRTALSPSAITCTDIDNDTFWDIVVVNQSSNSISIFKNTTQNTNEKTISFASKVDFSTGISPRSLAVGYLNSDNKIDIAVANYNSNTVSVFKSLVTKGVINSSSFGSRYDFAVGKQPTSIAIGSIDKKRLRNIATANLNDNTISILSPSKNYITEIDEKAYTNYTFSTGSQPYAVTFTHNLVNTKLTLPQGIAVANQSTQNFSYFNNLNNGNGEDTNYVWSITPKQDFITGTLPRAIVNTDVNGDGKLDIITANYSNNSISVLGSGSNPLFNSKVDFSVGKQPIGLVYGDFDADGANDLITINAGDQTISMLRSGIFGGINISNLNVNTIKSPLNKEVKGLFIIKTSHLLKDTINIVSNDDQLNFSLYKDSLFSSTIRFKPTNDSLTTDTIFIKWASGSVLKNKKVSVSVFSTHSISNVFDIDVRYGNPQISSMQPQEAYVGDTVNIYGNGFGTDTSKVKVSFGAIQKSVLFLNDSLIKVIVPQSAQNKKIRVLVNSYQIESPEVFYPLFSDTGVFDSRSFANPLNLQMTGFVTNTVVSDLNLDGKPDLVTSNYYKGVSINQNKSILNQIDTNSFVKGIDFENINVLDVAVSDLNNDKFPDILLTDVYTKHYSILQNLLKVNDSITVSSFGNKYDFNEVDSPSQVRSSDLNSDGKLDVISFYMGKASRYLINGSKAINSTFSNNSFENAIPIFGLEYGQYMTIEDLNNDQKPDVIISYPTSKKIAIYLNLMSNTFDLNGFSKPYFINSSQNPIAIEVFDINKDGFNDILIGDGDLNQVMIYQNDFKKSSNGSLKFLNPVSINVGNTPSAIKVADVDGDGLGDILATNYVDNKVTVSKSKGAYNVISSAMFDGFISFKVGAQPNSIDVADIDGDGRMELVVANSGEFSVSILRGQRGIAQSIEKIQTLQFQLFPNPAQSKIYINEVPISSKYEIYNILGVKVASGIFEDKNNEIPIEEFQNGFYFIRVSKDNYSGTMKFIKSNK